MKLLKRTMCLLLVATLALSLFACGGEVEPSSSQDTGSHRPDYEAKEEAVWEDTDGDFKYETVDWDGPAGYVIVVPAGNKEAKDAATILQDYYQKTAEVTLQIVTDASAEKDKEILIGKTKRSQSAKDLPEGQLKVSVQGSKLVFDGGHDVTVESAVNKFVRLAPEKGKALTFDVTTDFSTTVFLDGYEYVWGDEFEGTDVDMTKWGWHAHMGGTARSMISYDKDVIDAGDGRLKLRAIRYFDPSREGVCYKMPYSTVTKFNMNFVYGYAEIRARMPFFKGAWPSFWTQSTDIVSSKFGVKRTPMYFVEIDVFEVFGSPDTVVSNIHKWYDSNYYDYFAENNLEKPEGGSNHTQWNKDKEVWVSPNRDTLNREYHTYGWEWTPKVMSFYVDGSLIMTYDIVKSYDLCKDMTGFHDPEFVMFNNHVTSTDSTYQVGLIEDSLDKLPSEYFIDYFRLYQKKDGKSKIWLDETPNVYLDRK